jgi:hypothetical protein
VPGTERTENLCASSFATQAIHLTTLAGESAFKATIQQPNNAISELTGYKLGSIELVGLHPVESNHHIQQAFGKALSDTIESLPVIGPLYGAVVDSHSH